MEDASCPIQVPGFTHHGDCSLLCKPAEWKDIMIFFLGNYVSHAATVIGRPGQSSLLWAFSLLLALCCPGAGIVVGVHAISSLACFAPTELTKAVRAGAMCMIFKPDEIAFTEDDDAEARGSISKQDSTLEVCDSRQHGEASTRIHGTVDRRARYDTALGEMLAGQSEPPQSAGCICRGGICVTCTDARTKEGISVVDTVVREVLDEEGDEVFPPNISTTHVNGISRLPKGYRLLVLPKWVTFEDDIPATQGKGFKEWMEHTFSAPFRPRHQTEGSVSSSHNIVKIFASVGQLVYAALTLYETRGNQIATYGYAAFGLTVTPYILMSLLNLMGNLICPQYSTMFLVHSPALDKLRNKLKQNGLVHRYPLDSAVGRISKETEERVICSYGTVLRKNQLATMTLEFFFRAEKDTARVLKHMCIAVAIGTTPIAIVGALSLFQPGKSAPYQRVWTMLWLCLGSFVGPSLGSIAAAFLESRPVLWISNSRLPEEDQTQDREGKVSDNTMTNFSLAVCMVSAAVYTIPAMGGFVVVWKMLSEYGTCMKIA